jgi:hypothetical protein
MKTFIEMDWLLMAASAGPRSPLWAPKSVLESIQRPKRMNAQLDVAELIRQKCS